MLTKPVERTQIDGKQEDYSWDSAVDFTGTPELTRQEDGKQADIQFILNQFGLNAPQRTIKFGDQDTDMDLQQGYAALDEINAKWQNLPEKIRKQFRSYQAVMHAVFTGQLKSEELQNTRNGAAPEPPAKDEPTPTG